MSNMKYSGIEWIGNIPKNWIIKKIKYLKNSEENSFLDGDWIDSQYITDDGIRYYTTGNSGDGVFKEQGSGFISEETFRKLKCKYAYPGDLIFSRLNSPYGRSCILPNYEEKCIIAVDNVILRTDEDKKYICYVTQTDGYHKSVEDYSNGATMQRISRTNLGNVYIPLPPRREQKLISDFLDNKVHDIELIIANLNNQVEILENYKKSIINTKVTNGITPNINGKKLKIGRLVDLKQGLAINAQSNHLMSNVETSVALLRIADMNAGTKEVFMSEKTPKQYIAQKEDIIYTRTGQVGLVFRNKEGVVHNNCFRVFPKNENQLTRDYLYWTLKSDAFFAYANLLAWGSAQPDLSHSSFKMIEMTLFPLEEQKLIVKYLEEKCSKIDNILEYKKKQIQQMEQYKKSVIYEYVTGKKRVEGAEELYG